MKVFNFNPMDFAQQYRDVGYVHVPNGVNPDFLAFVQQALAEDTAQAEERSLEAWRIAKKKQQFLFDFPQETDFKQDVKGIVAQVAGLELEDLLLCERHIKVYDDQAAPNPPPHKDRLASQVTVGLPLQVPEDSYLILYPQTQRNINPYATTALYRDSLDEEELPENSLTAFEPEILRIWPGDVVFFKGSSIYHERVNPANTALLYLKFSGMNLDPLGEDPQTLQQWESSLKMLQSTDDQALLDLSLMVSPRVEKISRHYTRLHWREVLQLYIWGEKEITIDEEDLRLMKAISPRQSVRDTFIRLGLDEVEFDTRINGLKRLIRLGAIDLV